MSLGYQIIIVLNIYNVTVVFRLVEEFLQHHPEHVNLKGSEIDLSLLHFAAVRDNLEVANFLLQQVSHIILVYHCSYKKLNMHRHKNKLCVYYVISHCTNFAVSAS